MNKRLFSARYAVLLMCLAAMPALWLASCSDDKQPVNPPPATGDVFPLKTGNYYVYDVFHTDTAGVKIDSSRTDSVVVGAAAAVEGKSCFALSIFKNRSELVSGDFSAKESNAAWLYTTLLPYTIELPDIAKLLLPAGRRWTKICDFSNATWKVFDTTVTDITIPAPIPIIADATISITGTRGAKESVTTGGTTYTAQKSMLVYSVVGKTSGITATTFTFTHEFWIAEDVGIVKESVRGFNIPIPMFSVNQIVPGAQRLLLRHNVVK